MPAPVFQKLTPVVIVDRIEPLLPFYVDALGFVKVAEMPQGDRLGFVMLVHGTIELMFQTLESAQAGDSGRHLRAGPVCLYLDVADLDDVAAAIGAAPIVCPRRVAPYGVEEFFVLDPAGNTVGFARPVAAQG